MLKKLQVNKDQKGIASIIIVGILVILLSLVSIGFTRLVNRDASSALEDQKSQIASYAAESGINEVINYLQTTKKPVPQNNCQNGLLSRLNKKNGLSGNQNTQYTCVLLNLTPASLTYSVSKPLQSKVVKLQSPTAPTSIFVSWASNDGRDTAPSNTQNLLDEASWKNKNYRPVLRLTVYAIPPNNQLSGNGFIARTLFLYPNQSTGSNIVDLNGNNPVDGSLVPVNCSAQTIGSYSYTAPGSNYCSVVVNNLPSDNIYYMRLTPVYDAASITVKAQDASGDINFKNSQAVVDVTAKSTDVTKRLQATVDLNNTNLPPEIDNIPEYALQSAGTICKRYVVPPSGSPYIDSGSMANCGGLTTPGCVVPFAQTLPATGIDQNGATLNGEVRPNCGAATYYFEYAKGLQHVNGETLTQVPNPGYDLTIDQGIYFDYPVTYGLQINLPPNTDYHYRVCGHNSEGPGCGKFIPFRYNSSSGGGCKSDICVQMTFYGCGTVAHQYQINNTLTATGPGVPSPVQIAGNFIVDDTCRFPTPWVTKTYDLSQLGFTSNKNIVLKFSHGKNAWAATFQGLTITMPGQPDITPVFHYDNPSSCNNSAPPKCPTPFPLYLNNPNGGTATSNPT